MNVKIGRNKRCINSEFAVLGKTPGSGSTDGFLSNTETHTGPHWFNGNGGWGWTVTLIHSMQVAWRRIAEEPACSAGHCEEHDFCYCINLLVWISFIFFILSNSHSVKCIWVSCSWKILSLEISIYAWNHQNNRSHISLTLKQSSDSILR